MLTDCLILLKFTTCEKKTGFLLITTSEKKIGLLIIKVFRKHFYPQKDGHLDQHWVAISYLSGPVRISDFSQFHTLQTMREDL